MWGGDVGDLGGWLARWFCSKIVFLTVGLWLSSWLSYPQRWFLEDPRIPKLHLPHPGSEIIPGYCSKCIISYAFIYCTFTHVQMMYIYNINLYVFAGQDATYTVLVKKTPSQKLPRLWTLSFMRGFSAHLHIYIYIYILYDPESHITAGSCQIVFTKHEYSYKPARTSATVSSLWMRSCLYLGGTIKCGFWCGWLVPFGKLT